VDILVFQLGTHDLFGIEVLAIREIMPLAAVNKLPGAVPAISGCMDMRGTTVPVIKMTEVLFPGREASNDKMAIILDRHKPYALAVSLVDRIMRLNAEQVEKLQMGKEGSLISGVVNDDVGLIQILNPERVLDKLLKDA
jgi:two-component system chemotaxis response regulator CheV